MRDKDRFPVWRRLLSGVGKLNGVGEPATHPPGVRYKDRFPMWRRSLSGVG